MFCPCDTSSGYVMATPSAVSLSTTTNCEISTGSIDVIACGSRIDRMVWPHRMPSDDAASDCPRGSAFTPARTISAMTAPLYSVRPVTTPASVEYSESMRLYLE